MSSASASFDTDVLIVGAGPAGLALGCELLRAGVAFRIVDQLVEKKTHSQASVVHSRIQELMYFSGTLDRVRSEGHKMRPQRTHAFGRRLGDMRVDGLDAPYDGPWIIHQGHVETAMAEHLAEHGVAVARGLEFVGLTQDATGVTAELRGSDGAASTVRARYLVGADGSRSPVREALGVPFLGKVYNDEYEFYLGDISMPPTFPTEHGYTFLNRDGAVLLIIPQQGTHRIIVSRPVSGIDTRTPLPLEELQALVWKYGPKEAVLSNPTWLTRFGTQRKIAESLRVGRVLLAGDAAHQHVPLGGQGMNTGVSDSYNLGWKLGLVVRGRAPETLLDSYHQERHKVAQQLVDSTDKLFETASRAPLPLRLWMKNVGPIVFEKPFVQNRIRYALSQLRLEYHDSPAVGWAGRTGGLKAGHRAPDATVFNDLDGRPTRLFSLFRDPRHTLLLFSGLSDPSAMDGMLAAAAKIQSLYGDLIQPVVVSMDAAFPGRDRWDGPAFRDSYGKAHHTYGLSEAAFCLVRPDGYVGFAGTADQAGALHQYLDRFFTPPQAASAPATAKTRRNAMAGG